MYFFNEKDIIVNMQEVAFLRCQLQITGFELR